MLGSSYLAQGFLCLCAKLESHVHNVTVFQLHGGLCRGRVEAVFVTTVVVYWGRRRGCSALICSRSRGARRSNNTTRPDIWNVVDRIWCQNPIKKFDTSLIHKNLHFPMTFQSPIKKIPDQIDIKIFWYAFVWRHWYQIDFKISYQIDFKISYQIDF
jgi:hypothetical protein